MSHNAFFIHKTHWDCVRLHMLHSSNQNLFVHFSQKSCPGTYTVQRITPIALIHKSCANHGYLLQRINSLSLFAMVRTRPLALLLDTEQTVTKSKLWVFEFAQRQPNCVLHNSAGGIFWNPLSDEAQMVKKQ